MKAVRKRRKKKQKTKSEQKCKQLEDKEDWEGNKKKLNS